jgi:hypothetical protein
VPLQSRREEQEGEQAWEKDMAGRDVKGVIDGNVSMQCIPKFGSGDAW